MGYYEVMVNTDHVARVRAMNYQAIIRKHLIKEDEMVSLVRKVATDMIVRKLIAPTPTKE
jgi:hypothetical protein